MKYIVITVVLAVVALALLIVSGIRVHSSKQQQLAICNSNVLSFTMRCEHSAPYAVLLGVPGSLTGDLRYSGEMRISQSTGLVARVSIRANTARPCNWLRRYGDINGYILSWSEENREARLDAVLRPKETYNVQVSFNEQPPSGSSLWLSSIKKIGVFGKPE